MLDAAQAAGVKVVVTPLSLPGARTKQQNNNQFDDRLWSDKRYWQQSAAFWRDLAARAQGSSRRRAYNLVNEPVPEHKGGLEEHATPASCGLVRQGAWSARATLPAFYELLVAAVRGADERTPIMLDAGFYAAADAFTYWPEPLSDPRILYAYHMYEPWAATSAPNMKREIPYRYPGDAPSVSARALGCSARRRLSTATDRMGPEAPGADQPYGGGGIRLRAPLADCPRYLEDVLTVLEADGVHWAFSLSGRLGWDSTTSSAQEAAVAVLGSTGEGQALTNCSAGRIPCSIRSCDA